MPPRNGTAMEAWGFAGKSPWSAPPAGNVGSRADVRHGATASDAGTTAGMAGQEACSTA